MPKLPDLTGKELLTFLKSIGFEVVRRKGSHVRLRAEDGRVLLQFIVIKIFLKACFEK